MTLFRPFICINSFSSSNSLRKWVILYSYFIGREVKAQMRLITQSLENWYVVRIMIQTQKANSRDIDLDFPYLYLSKNDL